MTSPTAKPCRWCGAKNAEPHDGATHDAYAASDPAGVGYNAPTSATCRFCNERPAVVGGACGLCDEKLLDGLADHFGETRVPKCPVTVYTPQKHKCDRPLPCPVHGNPVRL